MHDRIKQLEKRIQALDKLYYAGEECIDPVSKEVISDNEYDSLRSELYKICPNSPIFETVTAQEPISGKKMKHDPPMTSIDKCNGGLKEKKEILTKWISKYYENFPNSIFLNLLKDRDVDEETIMPGFSMSYKHDGISLSINYKDGKIMQAGLRSKSGVDGIDVTDKLEFIEGVPETLPEKLTLTIRGEIETTKKEFARVSKELEESGKEPKSNPRAHTAGVMNRKKASEVKGMGLRFTAYSILNFPNAPYKTEMERADYARSHLNLNFVDTIPFSYHSLKEMENNHRDIDFMVDGCVISVNNLSEQEAMGFSGNSISANPKGKIAYKFADQVASVKVDHIEWCAGRTGNITPVLVFDPVELEGTLVKRCTAHNFGQLSSKKIGEGSIVNIIKSGKIIPKIKDVVVAAKGFKYPSKCPACKGETMISKKEDTTSLICLNEECSAKNIQKFCHYFSSIGVKGIAESTIEKLIGSGVVKEIYDFYKLDIKKLANIGIKERTCVLILARIKMISSPEKEKDNQKLLNKIEKINKVGVSIEKFIASMGIPGAGKEVGKLLGENFTNIDDILNLSEKELLNIEGIGPIIAKSIILYFDKNRSRIIKLLDHVELEFSTKNGILKGLSFVLSGSLENGKSYWEEFIRNNGGKISNSVSKKTNYLVAGEGAGAKLKKAESLNIKTISTNELEKLI